MRYITELFYIQLVTNEDPIELGDPDIVGTGGGETVLNGIILWSLVNLTLLWALTHNTQSISEHSLQRQVAVEPSSQLVHIGASSPVTA